MSEILVEFFLFKQKTAYEVRISDWSSDVCSSDLVAAMASEVGIVNSALIKIGAKTITSLTDGSENANKANAIYESVREDRKSVVEGKSVSVRVDLGGRRIIKKHNINKNKQLIRQELESREISHAKNTSGMS